MYIPEEAVRSLHIGAAGPAVGESLGWYSSVYRSAPALAMFA